MNVQSEINNLNSSNWSTNPCIITIPFPKSLNNQDTYVKPIVDDLFIINVLDGISVRVFLQYNNYTSITLYLYSDNANNIKKVSISYLIFSNNMHLVGNVAAYHYNFSLYKNISLNKSF